jgi:hypothetical protein
LEVAQAAAQQIKEASEAAGLPAFEGDAHARLMAVYKSSDPDIPLALKVDAAKAAIRYEKPALSSIDATITSVKSHEEMLAELEVEPEGEAEATVDEDAG